MHRPRRVNHLAVLQHLARAPEGGIIEHRRDQRRPDPAEAVQQMIGGDPAECRMLAAHRFELVAAAHGVNVALVVGPACLQVDGILTRHRIGGSRVDHLQPQLAIPHRDELVAERRRLGRGTEGVSLGRAQRHGHALDHGKATDGQRALGSAKNSFIQGTLTRYGDKDAAHILTDCDPDGTAEEGARPHDLTVRFEIPPRRRRELLGRCGAARAFSILVLGWNF